MGFHLRASQNSAYVLCTRDVNVHESVGTIHGLYRVGFSIVKISKNIVHNITVTGRVEAVKLDSSKSDGDTRWVEDPQVTEESLMFKLCYVAYS